MMDEAGLTKLAREIMALGYDEETAFEYAALIGDTPIMAEDGRVVVYDGDQELARLNLRSLQS